MRIVVSNPDSLGDVMLREPLFAAVHEAGHELMLVVRDFVAPFAQDIAPYAKIGVCIGNPYLPNLVLSSALDQELANQVDLFSPDLLVVAPYQYTELEQQLAARLPGVEVVGLSGHLVQPQPSVVAPSTISFHTKVQVSIETPEPTKNELLCSAILGKRVTLRAPRLSPTEAGRTLSTNHLKKIGLSNTPFWAVCAGDRPPWGLKNWERDKWIELCRTLIERHDIRILFIGTPEEDAGTKAIQAGLGLAARHTASITAGPITISELVGLLDAAQGYIGKDTGPMHLAAALGKPVVAVFGGGHWPRFVPLAQTGAAFSVDVPCKGCDWVCRLQRSYCVKDIPLAPVLRVVEKLINGDEVPFYVDLFPREGLLEAEMFRDMESAYKLLDIERTNFAQWHNDRLRDVEELTARVESARQEGFAEARAAMAAEIETLGKLRDTERANFEQWHGDRLRELEELTSKLESTRLEGAAAARAAMAGEIEAQVESRIRVAQEEVAASRDRTIAEANHRILRLETEVAILTSTSRDSREERGVLARQLGEARFQIDRLETRASALDNERGYLLDRTKQLEQANAEIGARFARAEAEKAGAEQTVFGLESEISQNFVTIAKLQTDIDTIESRHLGRIADLEKSLALQNRNNQVALALIPELRTDLISAQSEVDAWRTSFRDFAHRLGRSGSAPKELLQNAAERLESAEFQVFELVGALHTMAGERAIDGDWRQNLDLLQSKLENAENTRQGAEREIAELAARLRSATGHEANGADWRRSLDLVETDRQNRLDMIHELHRQLQAQREHSLSLLRAAENQIAECTAEIRQAGGTAAATADWRAALSIVEKDRAQRLVVIEELSGRLQAVEEDRAKRGEQIHALHQHIADLALEREAQLNRVPIRLLRALHIL